jgi:hypothetical protein
MQDQLDRQSQVIADQQRQLQALKNKQQPPSAQSPAAQPQPAAQATAEDDWSVKTKARFSHLDDLLLCFNVYDAASGVKDGKLTYIDNDQLYQKIFDSKLDPSCGRPFGKSMPATTYQNVLNAAISCPRLSEMLSYIMEHHPNAPPSAWYEATLLSVPFIHCTYDAPTQPIVSTSPPQSLAAQGKPDCSDFDAVVAYMKKNAVAGGIDFSDPIMFQGLLQAARQYQVYHGCRAPAPVPAPVTTNCRPSAFHDGSFACTTE